MSFDQSLAQLDSVAHSKQMEPKLVQSEACQREMREKKQVREHDGLVIRNEYAQERSGQRSISHLCSSCHKGV